VTRVTNFGDSDSTRVTLRKMVTRLESHYSQNEKQHPSCLQRTAPIAHSFCEGCTWRHLHVLFKKHYFVGIGKAEQQVHNASHCGTNQQ